VLRRKLEQLPVLDDRQTFQLAHVLPWSRFYVSSPVMPLQILADVLFARGLLFEQHGRPKKALRSFSLAARLVRSDPRYPLAAAKAATQAGDRDTAARYCERVLRINPESALAHALLSRLYLHGPGYLKVLADIHRHLQPRSYVEIGVATGDSLRLIQRHTRAVGIDPDPKIPVALPPNVRVYAETSDEFFARRNVAAELDGLPVELAFIDGMHHFEFALRDFINLERHCTPSSTILIHDCFPHDRRSAQRERVTDFWTGDVWRLILLLKKYRPELRVHTIAAPASGLGIVRNLDPASRFLAANVERLVKEFMALDYAVLEADRIGKLNLLGNDWESIRAVLDGAPAAA
jgi:tetratricopeptide (TPR) repeat protein